MYVTSAMYITSTPEIIKEHKQLKTSGKKPEEPNGNYRTEKYNNRRKKKAKPS